MINVEYSQDRPTISLVGTLTDEVALELVDEMQRLVDEHFFTEIRLDIASSGGSDTALAQCIQALFAHWEAGVRVVTRTRTTAASAAAVLLSMGQRRIAAPGAQLVYHHGQAVGANVISGATAKRIAEMLEEADAWIIAALVERARLDGANDDPASDLRVRDFARADWDVVGQVVGLPGNKAKRGLRKRLLKRLRRQVAVAVADRKPDRLARLYHRLCVLDRPISAALARELRLIDAACRNWEDAKSTGGEDGAGGLRVPEWESIFPPAGDVSRQTLCRHALILGETGSGKTVSGILPVVGAMLDEASPVGCALVIDPKNEIGRVVRSLADECTEVVEINLHRKHDERAVVDLMAGSRSVQGDLLEGRVLTAARAILIRASSLSANNPAKLLAGKTSAAREPYWEMEGTRLAQTVLALVLTLYAKAGEIFGTSSERGALVGAPEKVRAVLGSIGARAGIAVTYPDIETVAQGARARFGSEDAPEVRRTDIARDVRDTGFYKRCDAFREDFEALKANCPEPRDSGEYNAETRRLIDAACGAAVRSRKSFQVKLGPNVLALAHDALQEAFCLDRPNAGNSSQGRGGKPNFLAAAASESLRSLDCGGEIDEMLELIDSYWNPMASTGSAGQYTGAFGLGRTCLVDFADPAPARTLYFGCEPGFQDHRYESTSLDYIGFHDDVAATSARKVYLFRPELGATSEALVARALKATFFEAILGCRRRQEDGASMPLVGYIADEAHRFVTSDAVHGEQSFLDTCRSFNTFCVLASQSVASLKHAFSVHGGDAVTNENAIEILLTNTANKLIFRSTDPGVREYLERLCPAVPGRTSVLAVRPPSTLKPGECYAVLADGRIKRKQLRRYLPAEVDAAESPEGEEPEAEQNTPEPEA